MKINSALLILTMCAACVLLTSCGKSKTRSKLSDDYSVKDSSASSVSEEADSGAESTETVSPKAAKTAKAKSKSQKPNASSDSSVNAEITVPDEWLESETEEKSPESPKASDSGGKSQKTDESKVSSAGNKEPEMGGEKNDKAPGSSSESSSSQDQDKINSASPAVTSLPSGFVRQN